MIISQLPELFVQRERALLGPRFDAMFSYPGQGAVRGASVNALRCTPQQFAALADFPLEESPCSILQISAFAWAWHCGCW